jgi:integrase
MTMLEDSMIDIYLAYENDLRLRQADPRSVQSFRRVSRRWQSWMAENGVTTEAAKKTDVQAFLLSTGWSPRTMRSVGLAYLRACFEFAVEDLEVLDRNPCRRVRLPRVPVRPVTVVQPSIARQIKTEVRDERDDLLLRLFMYTGMRTCEVTRLTWADVDLEANTLLAKGKADKWRTVPIHPELRRALLRVPNYLTKPEYFVVPGRYPSTQVGPPGLLYRTRRLWGEHGVTNHMWRRTVASSLRANGVQREVLDALLGWSDGTVFTNHYSAIGPAELQTAILKLYQDSPF